MWKINIVSKRKIYFNGKLADIKESYAKKNILIKGNDIDITAIKKIKGVISVENTRGEYLIKVENKSVAPKVFALVKNSEITKYDVVEPTLNEIFIEAVGGIHE